MSQNSLFTRPNSPHLPTTRPLRPSEPPTLHRLGMQLPQHPIFRDLARLLHLELLIDIQSFLARHLEHGPLHQRVQHALLDSHAPAIRAGVGVEEEDGRLLGAVVRVRVPEKRKPRFRRGDGLDEVGDGRCAGRGRDELDGFGCGIDFLLRRLVTIQLEKK